MKTRVQVDAFKINIYCDECSKKPNPGCILKQIGPLYLTDPPKYIYECPLCNKKFEFYECYPHYDFVEKV